MAYMHGFSGANHRSKLRLDAETLIHAGAAPATGGTTLSVEALELLYRQASNPEFAADALKLLHELQTHQVELDLLFDQLQSSENELIEDLAHYKALYELAPVPYLIVDGDGRVVQSNQAAQNLSGLGAERLTDRYLSDFLSPSSQTTMRAMLGEVMSSKSGASCVAQLSSDLGVDGRVTGDGRVTMEAKLGTHTDCVLMVLSPGPAIDGS